VIAADQLPAGDNVDAISRRWRRIELPTTIGDYELLEEVERGGTGVVFRPRPINLNREFAVKMILRGRLVTDIDRSRFLTGTSSTAR